MKSKNIIFNVVIQSAILLSPLYGSPKGNHLTLRPEVLLDKLANNCFSMNHQTNNENTDGSYFKNNRPSIYEKHDIVVFACPCDFEFEGVYRAIRESKQFKETSINEPIRSAVFSSDNVSIILYVCGKGYANPRFTISIMKLLESLSYQCDAVFLFGSCGSVSDDILAGDICLPLSFNDANSGRRIGSNSNGEPLRNVINASNVINYNNLYINPAESQTSPSEDLVNFVIESINDAKNAIGFKFTEFSEDRLSLEKSPIRLVLPEGLASSGAFTHSPSSASLASEVFNSDIVDMETYPFARACESLSVPFVAIRVPSDDAGRNGYNMIDNCGRFVAAYNLGIAANIIATALATNKNN